MGGSEQNDEALQAAIEPPNPQYRTGTTSVSGSWTEVNPTATSLPATSSAPSTLGPPSNGSQQQQQVSSQVVDPTTTQDAWNPTGSTSAGNPAATSTTAGTSS